MLPAKGWKKKIWRKSYESTKAGSSVWVRQIWLRNDHQGTKVKFRLQVKILTS